MENNNRLIKILEDFKNKKIGIIGDLILDKYILGNASRISPEAPVPVVLFEKEISIPGGAANVANNVSSLGANAFLGGIVGNDGPGDKLENILKEKKINTSGIIKDFNRPTTKKTRIIAQTQQIIRIDKEKTNNIKSNIEEKLIDYINSNLRHWDALIISDYNKGLITKKLGVFISKLYYSYNLPVIVDAKPKQAEFFENTTIIKPNYKEAFEIAGSKSYKLNKIGRIIQEKLDCNVLITLGSKGMVLFEKDQIYHVPAKAKEIYDVSGAGDTVSSLVALSLASGSTLKEATYIANHGAGIVIGKRGTATVSINELKKSLENDKK